MCEYSYIYQFTSTCGNIIYVPRRLQIKCCPNDKFTNFSKGVPQNGTPFVHLCRKVMNMDKHAERIEIFNSTLKLIEQGWYKTPSGEEMELPQQCGL